MFYIPHNSKENLNDYFILVKKIFFSILVTKLKKGLNTYVVAFVNLEKVFDNNVEWTRMFNILKEIVLKFKIF